MSKLVIEPIDQSMVGRGTTFRQYILHIDSTKVRESIQSLGPCFQLYYGGDVVPEGLPYRIEYNKTIPEIGRNRTSYLVNRVFHNMDGYIYIIVPDTNRTESLEWAFKVLYSELYNMAKSPLRRKMCERRLKDFGVTLD